MTRRRLANAALVALILAMALSAVFLPQAMALVLGGDVDPCRAAANVAVAPHLPPDATPLARALARQGAHELVLLRERLHGESCLSQLLRARLG